MLSLPLMDLRDGYGHLFWAESWGNRQGEDIVWVLQALATRQCLKPLGKCVQRAAEARGSHWVHWESGKTSRRGHILNCFCGFWGANKSNLQILNQKQTWKSERDQISTLSEVKLNWRKQLRSKAQRGYLFLVLSDFKLNATGKHSGCREQKATLKKYQAVCKMLCKQVRASLEWTLEFDVEKFVLAWARRSCGSLVQWGLTHKERERLPV